ncbi:MAG: C45 family autoproteolytic acyltransferase/hydrolase, partial [Chloroflexota bacterium]
VSAPPPAPSMPAKDPGVLPAANEAPADGSARANGKERGNEQRAGAEREAAATPAADGCTSVASRGQRGVVVGHTEDSSPEAIDGLYLLDATIVEPQSASGATRSRFLALNYAQTLPGCAAAANEHGLIVLVDALPDPDRRVGAPRHFVSRALLDLPSIDAAIDHLRTTERGGGWNYLLAQGERIVNVETTATRVVVQEVDGSGTYAHSNHYLDDTLAADTGDPRPNSLARLTRALELVSPGMDVAQMKGLLADRQDFPDSICRERTIGAFVADTATRQIEVCWGEPDTATWVSYSF